MLTNQSTHTLRDDYTIAKNPRIVSLFDAALRLFFILETLFFLQVVGPACSFLGATSPDSE